MPLLSFTGLRSRLLALVLLAVIPTVGLVLYTGAEQRQLEAEQVQANTLHLARVVASNQEQLVEGARQLLVVLAQLTRVHSHDSIACSTLFAELLKQYPLYLNLGAAEPDGDVFCNAVPLSQPTNVADRLYIQRALQTGDFTFSDYQIGRITSKPSLNFAYPAFDETGAIQAVVFAALDLAWLNQLAREIQLPPGATFTLIDRQGTILARYPDPEKWVGQSLPDAPLIRAILAQEEGTAEVAGVDDVARLYAFTPLLSQAEGSSASDNGAYISIGIPSEVAFAGVDQTLVRQLLGLGLVSLLTLAVAWFFSDVFILHRVQALVRAAGRLSTGDLSTRTGLPHEAGELSQLARALDDMAEALQQREIERRQVEETLQASQAQLAGIIASTMDAVITIDAEQRIILFNAAAEQMFGCSAAEVIGQPLDRFIPPRFRDAHQGHIRTFGRTKVSNRSMGALGAVIGLRADGQEFPVEASISQVEAAGQKLYTAVLRDITERKRTEEHLKQTLAELARSNAELQQFAYVASHDLQEPLRMVASYTQLLARRYKGQLDPDADDFIAFAVDGANRLQRLINDLLTYSRVGTRGKPLEPTSAEVALEHALANLQLAVAESQAVVTHDPLPMVLADDTQLVQLFQNLIGNALKFRNEQSPLVHISAEPKNHEWLFTVRDNGIGLEPEYAERIFVIFQRLHSKAEFPGTGIGLALCKRIVERHGGRIWVESQSGQGATFYFTLFSAEVKI